MKNLKKPIFILCMVIFSPIFFVKAQCPTNENDTHKSIIESFVIDSSWQNIRNQTGLSGIIIGNVIKLSSQSYENACQQLKSDITEGEFKYNYFFYKIRDKYIVVSVIKQPSDPNKVALGLSFLEIYDSNFNRLEGYSF